jgi:hypothetical protein
MKNRRVSLLLRSVLLGVTLFSSMAVTADAHHILGVPHYAYDDDYPQTPVLTYRVDAGAYDVKMTGYPGKVEPGQRCSLHLYVHHKASGEVLDVPITMRVTLDRLLVEDPVVYGPMQARLDERIYKFHPHFDEEGEYLVNVQFEADGEPWSIDLPLVVGEPSSPLLLLGTSVAGLTLLIVALRAIRIKRARYARVGATQSPA